ncbi:sodium:solute symporter [Oleomonas cavernae]|uniref:Sodium:solute symporter n=1 Tax=Oleomonas cavernae TaxID=2320859 RepID=A0A418WID8_9PROT|nr:sodium:solute symporter [Oleomonas cavernae]RJF89807.1 sodium:solute symporter [Oleomonas cavernae]
MDKTTLLATPGLTPALGFAVMIGLGLFSLAISFWIRNRLVRNTHDFIISDRKVGFGFGVGSLIAVWTWAMAVMMSAAMTFQWGLSGLFWFVVPNGFAVMILVPFTRVLRKHMPNGYTISEFVQSRFNQSKVASSIVTATMIFGIILEILINLKGTSIVISSVFGINWAVAAVVGMLCVLIYSYFGGLWTSVMTATINTLMITVPAAIVVSLVYDQVPGGASAVFSAVGEANENNLTVFRADAAAGFGITLAFGLLAATVADQTFWQKAWSFRADQVNKTFLWAGALFYPIPICLGMLGLVGIAYGITAADIGGDIAAIGPYVVSHIGLPVAMVVVYVLVILAACYSTIDGASAALASVVAVDIVKRFAPNTSEKALFIITKVSMLLGGSVALAIVLSGVDFTTLVLTTYALKTAILLPLVLAILWPQTNTVGFVGGISLAILIGMPLREVYGELIGTTSIVLISGLTVVIAGLIKPAGFDYSTLRKVRNLDTAASPAE